MASFGQETDLRQKCMPVYEFARNWCKYVRTSAEVVQHPA